MEQRHRTKTYLARRTTPTLLVVGEIVCDVHMLGTCVERRTTPVFSPSAQYDALGGAAGTAYELLALGCDVRLLSVVGADSVGRRMRDLLRQQRIPDTLVLEDIGRPTAQRTHLCGQGGPVLCLVHDDRAGVVLQLESDALGRHLWHRLAMACAERLLTAR